MYLSKTTKISAPMPTNELEKQIRELNERLERNEELTVELKQLLETLLDVDPQRNPSTKQPKLSDLALKNFQDRQAALMRASKTVGSGKGAVSSRATEKRLQKDYARMTKGKKG